MVSELHKRGFYTGLWSSTGLPNITREVAGSGVRIGKTDVGWIGSGYKVNNCFTCTFAAFVGLTLHLAHVWHMRSYTRSLP